jgi:hypothetical protein
MESTFLSYLMASEQKTYDFKIKFADQEPTDEYMDRLEHALAAYDVVKISKPKHIITGEASQDFPNFGHCDVYMVSVSLKYPCTDDQLRSVLSNQARIPIANIRVIPAGSPEEQHRDSDKSVSKEVNGQDLVGQKRLDNLKKLPTRKYEFSSKDETVEKTMKDSKTTSPINGKIKQQKEKVK